VSLTLCLKIYTNTFKCGASRNRSCCNNYKRPRCQLDHIVTHATQSPAEEMCSLLIVRYVRKHTVPRVQYSIDLLMMVSAIRKCDRHTDGRTDKQHNTLLISRAIIVCNGSFFRSFTIGRNQVGMRIQVSVQKYYLNVRYCVEYTKCRPYVHAYFYQYEIRNKMFMHVDCSAWKCRKTRNKHVSIDAEGPARRRYGLDEPPC